MLRHVLLQSLPSPFDLVSAARGGPTGGGAVATPRYEHSDFCAKLIVGEQAE